MKENKKIEKELLFKNKIKDITSISLDSDYKIDNNEVVGNFLVSGEYKTHEICLNRESFNFKIPFKEQVDEDIDLDTVNIEITNFLYDYKNDELIVNIEYELIGDRKDVLIFDDEESLEEFLNSKEVEVVDTRIEEIRNEIDGNKDQEKEEVIEENEEMDVETLVLDSVKEEIKCDLNYDVKEEKDVKEDREEIMENKVMSSDEIISNISNINEGFITYKVYKIKENETLESIVIKYNTTIDELKEYNDLNNLSINDKLIIPIHE